MPATTAISPKKMLLSINIINPTTPIATPPQRQNFSKPVNATCAMASAFSLSTNSLNSSISSVSFWPSVVTPLKVSILISISFGIFIRFWATTSLYALLIHSLERAMANFWVETLAWELSGFIAASVSSWVKSLCSSNAVCSITIFWRARSSSPSKSMMNWLNLSCFLKGISASSNSVTRLLNISSSWAFKVSVDASWSKIVIK